MNQSIIMVLQYAFNHTYPYQCQDLSAPPIWPLFFPTGDINFTQALPKYMKTRLINMQINALEIYLPRQPALTFISIKFHISNLPWIGTKCLDGEFVPNQDRNKLDRSWSLMLRWSKLDRSKCLDRNKIIRLNTWTEPVPVLVRNNYVV